MTTDRRTVFPVLEALLRRARWVVGVSVGAAVLTAIIVLVLRPTYSASASFVAENPVTPRLPPGLSGLASQFGMTLGAEASRSPAFYADLLRSREILGQVLRTRIAGPTADSITVYELYSVSGPSRERQLDEGIKALRKRITLSVDQRTDVVHVTVEAPYAPAARDVLQVLLNQVADFNLHTRQSTAGSRRQFIEGRVADSEKQLKGAEQSLRAFYDRNRQWQASPQLRFEEQALNRQVAVQQELYLTLRREYETARIEEVNNTPVLTIIDRPTIPGRRSRPRRGLTVLIVTVVVGVLMSVAVIILQNHEDLLASGDVDYLRFYQRIRALRGSSTIRRSST
jgi:uncharacterized protein involved in exopolysaccharide biosynthesis